MILFIGILLIVWPIIAYATFAGIAVHKKCWSYSTLSRICGVWGILLGIYYFLILGGLNSSKDTWPVWFGGIFICGWGNWYMMRNTFERIQQREREKED